MKRVPCYQKNAEYAGAGAYKAIEKATGETSGKGFTKTPKKSHEVASSIHNIYEAEEIYKRERWQTMLSIFYRQEMKLMCIKQ